MKKILTFSAGFLAGLLAFTAINLVVAHLRSDCGLPGMLGIGGCADAISRAGFPLIFYESGGFAYHTLFDTGPFLVDGLTGLAFSAWAGSMAVKRKQS